MCCACSFEYDALFSSLGCHQVLPRYIVHFVDHRPPGAVPAPPLSLTASDHVVLWVDHYASSHASVIQELIRRKPGLVVQTVGSSHEARAWLKRADQEKVVEEIAEAGRLRVISSHYLTADDSALDGSRLLDMCNELHIRCPRMLMLCSIADAPHLSHEHSPHLRQVIVTHEDEQATRFGAFEMTFGACLLVSSDDQTAQALSDTVHYVDMSVLVQRDVSVAATEGWLVSNGARSRQFASDGCLRVLIDARGGSLSVADADGFATRLHQARKLGRVEVMLLCTAAQAPNFAAFADATKHQQVETDEVAAVWFAALRHGAPPPSVATALAAAAGGAGGGGGGGAAAAAAAVVPGAGAAGGGAAGPAGGAAAT